jgi:Transaldolase/Fructose-6-phosphate aldolase
VRRQQADGAHAEHGHGVAGADAGQFGAVIPGGEDVGQRREIPLGIRAGRRLHQGSPAPGHRGIVRSFAAWRLGYRPGRLGHQDEVFDISRDRLRTGNLQQLIDDCHVVGVTSTPTIFAHAVDHGDAYDGQLADLTARGVLVEEASRAITTYDIRRACDVLRPVHDATAGLDGRVSIEIGPRVAKNTRKTIAEARNLWWMVDRPNLFIRIPATREGLAAITQAISEGISVNVTLIFSLQRYGDAIGATSRAWSRPGRPGVTCPRSARWRRSSSAGRYRG